MNSLRLLHVGVVAALALSTSAATAQIKFANFSPTENGPAAEKSVVFEEAKDRADLKHGTLVTLNLMDGTKVIGHVVRFDDKHNRLYVRTKPSQAPVAFEEQNLRQIAKAVRPPESRGITQVGFVPPGWRDIGKGLEENENGVVRIKAGAEPPGVKAASFRDDRRTPERNGRNIAGDDSTPVATNVVEPEIIKQVTYNGSQRTVTYFSTVVSPGEREMLEKLQTAENDYLALVAQQALRDTAIAQELSFQEQQLRTQQLINATLMNENTFNYPYVTQPPTAAGVPEVVRSALPPLPLKGAIALLPQPLPSAGNILARIPPVDQQALAKAREELLQLMRNNAAYEDGRLVAVFAKAP